MARKRLILSIIFICSLIFSCCLTSWAMPDLDEDCDDEDQDGDDVDEDVDHESDEEAGTSGGAFSETAQKIDRLISNQAVTS